MSFNLVSRSQLDPLLTSTTQPPHCRSDSWTRMPYPRPGATHSSTRTRDRHWECVAPHWRRARNIHTPRGYGNRRTSLCRSRWCTISETTCTMSLRVGRRERRCVERSCCDTRRQRNTIPHIRRHTTPRRRRRTHPHRSRRRARPHRSLLCLRLRLRLSLPSPLLLLLLPHRHMLLMHLLTMHHSLALSLEEPLDLTACAEETS
jgi:hypothetical protein